MCLCEIPRPVARLLAVVLLAIASVILWAQAANPQQVSPSSRADHSAPAGQAPQANQPAAPNDSAASLSGHVYRADTGAPVGGVIVTLEPGIADVGVRGASVVMGGITGSDGAFRFTDLDAGSYVVWSHPDGLWKQLPTRAVNVAAGQDATNDIRLQPAGIISGAVTDQDGEPIEGMLVTVLGPQTAQAKTLTDDQGGFRLIGLSSGEWYVCASTFVIESDADSGVTYYPNADAEANATLVKVTAGSETPGIHIVVTVRRSGAQQPGAQQNGVAEGSIAGHVTGNAGAPVASAIVFLYRSVEMQPGGPPRFFPPKLTQTSADGTYQFDGLTSGDYSIEVHHPGFLRFPENGPLKPVSVSTRPVSDVDAQLKPAGIISGTLRGENGTALAGIGVSLIPKGNLPTQDTPAQAMTDDRGNFRMAAAPGSYYVLVGSEPGGMLSPLGYEPAYYPGSESLEKAQAIDVMPGKDAPALSFTVKRSPTFSVNVKVPAPGEPNSGYFTVGIQKLTDAAANAPVPPRRPVLVAANQTVRLHGCSPGTYRVDLRVANVRWGRNGKPIGFGGGGMPVGSATIQVNDSDVNVTVPISSFH